MATPDPDAFATDRTVIKPRPRTPGQVSSGAPLAPDARSGPAVSEPSDLQLLNPLVSAAAKLLVLVGRLRHLVQPPDVAALRAALADAVTRFDASARSSGASNESVLAARYVLCTALDESVANTPWGAQAGWSKQSLLVQFHNETWGGEKVFQLLGRLALDVPTHRPLLELIYSVLALGFEGRYRVIDNGRAQLEGVRQRLADLIRRDRPAPEAELSPHWRGEGTTAGARREPLPLWVLAAGMALLLALIWLPLRLVLNHRSDSTYAAVSALRVPVVATITATMTPAATTPRLARFLASEIEQGLVTVTDQADRSTVRLRGDSFFGSGSAEPTGPSLPVLARIAKALAEVPGEVLITGHSDNQPIRSLRYPSNWHLSAARAEAVRAALANTVAPARMRADGRADAEPLVPNSSAAERAQNRRVEIVLLTPPVSPAGVAR